MSGIDRVLLVEGESDQKFYELLCNRIALPATVRVAPPKDIGGPLQYNTKGGIFTFLPTLIKQMFDGKIRSLAAVMDADYASAHGRGYANTLTEFAALVERYGFSRRFGVGPVDGFSFKHNDGLRDLGLWVMPNNKDDGMIEDWIKVVASPNERSLLNHAVSTLSKLPFAPKFKQIHRAKAEVATWLAWQEIPGQGLHQALRNDLVDVSGRSAQPLVKWLHRIFY